MSSVTEKSCEQPSKQANGHKTTCPAPFIYGAQCTYECDPGYELPPNSVSKIKCDLSPDTPGTVSWDDTPDNCVGEYTAQRAGGRAGDCLGECTSERSCIRENNCGMACALHVPAHRQPVIGAEKCACMCVHVFMHVVMDRMALVCFRA